MARKYVATEKQIQKAKEKLQNTKEKSKTVLKDIILNYKTDIDVVMNYLQFSSQFYQYSTRNTALVYSQNPYATFVQSFQGWKKMNCYVNKGAVGMTILVPKPVFLFKRDDINEWVKLSDATQEEKRLIKEGIIEVHKTNRFGTGTVFDISQTNYPVEDYPLIFNVGSTSNEHSNLFNNLKYYCENMLDYNVETYAFDSISLRGQCNHTNHCIYINSRLDDTERLKTLSHEVGHAILHSDENARDKSEAQREVEADIFSILTQCYFKFDIQNSQKEHLQFHFENLEKEMNTDDKKDVLSKFEQIIDEVFSIYRKQAHVLDEIYHDKELQKEINGVMENDFFNEDDEIDDYSNEEDEFVGKSR